MENGDSARLSAAAVNKSVLDNLTSDASNWTFINARLNSALKDRLVQMFQAHQPPALVGLIRTMPPVDIAANKDVSVRALLASHAQEMVRDKPDLEPAVASALSQLSDTVMVGELLRLDMPIATHSLFQHEARKATLGAILSTLPTFADNPPLREEFVNLYAGQAGLTSHFWNELAQRTGFDPPGMVKDIQIALQLGRLTHNNPGLVAAIRAALPVESLRDLTKLAPDDWKRLIGQGVAAGTITIPDAIPGESQPARIDNYVDSIMKRLRAAYPTAYVAQAVATAPTADLGLVREVLERNPDVDPLKRPEALDWGDMGTDDRARALAGLRVLKQEARMFPGLDHRNMVAAAPRSDVVAAALINPTRRAVARFFANVPDFDFRTTHIDRFIAQKGETAFQAVDNPQQVTTQLKTMQRVFQVAPDYQAMSALMGAGLDSAHKITSMPRQTFVRELGDSLGGEAAARETYARAEYVTGAVAQIYTQFAQALNDVTPRAARAAADLEQFPDLATLFGQVDLCDCPDCRSVYSPAAYFVDLLYMLQMSTANPPSPLDVLLSRRPDLEYIKLTCENTNTALPYVDLVNEILESYVVLGKLDASVAKDTGDSTAAELSAEPQYTNAAAYDRLRQAVFPPTMPYNQPTYVVRAYLEQLGSSRYEVMQTFRRDGHPSDLELAGEYLRLSSEEWTVITGPVAHWRFDEGSGTTAADAAGNNNVGTLSGATWTQGKVGAGALSFDGVQASVGIEISPSLKSVANSFTIAFWVNPAATHKIDLEATVGTAGSAGQHYAFYPLQCGDPAIFGSDDHAGAGVSVGTNGISVYEHSNSYMPALLVYEAPISGWTHVSVVYENRQPRLYVNGKPERTGLTSPKPFVHAMPGGIGGGIEGHFQGQIDDVRIYDGVLPGEAIAALASGDQNLNGFYYAPDHQPADLVAALHPVREFLKQTGLSYPDLIELLKTHFVNPGQALTLDAPPDADPCDLDQTTIKNLDLAALGKMHRFIRLWRKVGGAMAELDKCLTALQTADMTADFLQKLARVKRLQADLKLSPVQIYSLWADIDTQGDDALYKKVFLNRAVLNPNDPSDSGQAFLPNADGSVLTDTSKTISGHVLPLMAALRISAPDLALIRTDVGLAAEDAPLTLANVSALYRYAILARALMLSLRDLIDLRTFAGADLDPFSAPDRTIRFVKLVQKVQPSGFSVAQLNYLYRHLLDPAGSVAPGLESLHQIIRSLHEGLTRIAADYVVADDPTGDLTRSRLGELLESAVVDQAVQMINGSAVYTELFTSPTPVQFPADLTGRIAYDSNAKLLRLIGPLSNEDRDNLLTNVSPARLRRNTKYRAAINGLHQQPRTFIADKLSGFLDTAHAVATLLDNQPPTTGGEPLSTEGKFSSVLDRLSTYLRTVRGTNLVKQTLGSALKLDAPMVDLLLQRLNSGQIGTAGLALSETGVSATYFSDPELTTATVSRIDPGIAFGENVPATAAIPPGTGSARWSGLLVVSNNAAYRFYVRTAGAARLWLGDGARPIIDVDVGQTADESASDTMDLRAGQLYDLRLEVRQMSDPAVVELRWSSDGTPKDLIPPANLYPASIVDTFVRAFTLLHKVSLIVNACRLTAREVAYLLDHAADFAGFDLQSLPLDRHAPGPVDQQAVAFFRQWQRLSDYATLRDSLPAGEGMLIDVFGAAVFAAGLGANNPRAASAALDVRQKLLAATGWDAVVLDALTGAAGFNLAVDTFKNEVWLLRLQAALQLAMRLGVLPAQLFQWATVAPSVSQAQDIKRTIKALYDEETWLTVAGALHNRLRESQRDALTAYLLPRLGLSDSNQLFEFFLIDVDMSACMATSRIKQAIASVQLFVQRCLMNLEPAVSPTTIDPDLWQWMKQYRVWEANRKVFLYPENWIEPELRDDQSPFFKDLHTELLQSDMTPEVAETAFLHYLAKLDQVARLEICGLYWQLETDETGQTIDVLHVFGRTFAVPYIYYYRRLKNRSVWTAWERVDLDIVGDHLIPVVFSRRLYLFWPIFTQKVPINQQLPAPNTPGTPPQKYWEISLAWSEYKQGNWLPKQVSSGPDGILSTDLSLNYIVIPDDSDRREYVFETSIHDDEQAAGIQRSSGQTLIIQCHRGDKEHVSQDATTGQVSELVTEVGRFVVSSSGGTTAFNTGRIDPTANQTNTPVLPGSVIEAQTFAGSGAPAELSLISIPTIETAPVRTFTSLPSPYQVLHPRQFISDFTLQAPDPYKYQPFFYQDKRRTYFVMPEEAQEAVGTRTEARFAVHYHPYVWAFIRALNTRGLPGLLTVDNQRPTDKGFVFYNQYKPTYRVPLSYPEEDVDFDYGGAYALYNWELFFHAPLLIAAQLGKNQQFEAAQKWFHYIFDPTAPDPTMPEDRLPEEWARERYWKVLPFQRYEWDRIADLLNALSYTGDDESMLAYKKEVVAQVNEWLYDPFNPHAIARLRQVAYQKSVVMKYIDNLIAWGDQLFRQNTLETINQATQLYVLAADLLGPRPERIPPRGAIQPETYNSLKDKLDIFSNTLVALENQFPFSTTAPPGGPNGGGPLTTLTVGRTLYFGIPQNDRLLGYWGTVADRLFKIRHCLNIEGVAQQLPLFEPPIEPGLLVQAAAMGVDLGSALNDVNAATPYYRFGYMLQKAQELCTDLKSLGAALLSALEKRDGEVLSLLRSTHEIQVLSAVRQVRVQQVEEARQTWEGLQKSRLVTEKRHNFYSTIPQRIDYENTQVEQLGDAQDFQIAAQVTGLAASVAYMIPDLVIGISGAFSSPVTTLSLGGKNIGSALQATSQGLSFIASLHSHNANMASIQGAWARRSDDWGLQADLAYKELDQIDKQILAAQIRKEIAEQEVKNHDLQIENARAVDDYLRHKYTNQELYDWMVSQTSTLYFQTYQMAYDLARRAEKAYRFERGVTTSSFIQFGYWDSLKQGLLAGEQLSLALKQMEKAFMEQNKREYEITKQVSLRLHDPLALIALKETGCCYITLPEALFDVDYPGHYMRRIRSVSLTVPCVVGPYTSINCTLTLLGNKIRVSSNAQADYYEQEDDLRFINNFAAVQSIATSHAQNDSGLFELNFRDERYLPFEGAGAVSEWRIDLPRECNAFDFETISDVIIKLSYTAREGGELLRKKAWNAATLPAPHAQKAHEPLGAAPAQEGLTRLYSARHEFSGEWHRFLTPLDAASGQTLSLDLSKERFPFQYRGRDIHINQVELFLTFKSDDATTLYRDNGAALKVSLTPPGGTAASGSLTSLLAFFNGVPHGLIDGGAGLGTWTLAVADDAIAAIASDLRHSVTVDGTVHQRLKADAIQDLVIVCHYAIT